MAKLTLENNLKLGKRSQAMLQSRQEALIKVHEHGLYKGYQRSKWYTFCFIIQSISRFIYFDIRFFVRKFH